MEEKQELKVHGSFVGVLRKEDGTVTTTDDDAQGQYDSRLWL